MTRPTAAFGAAFAVLLLAIAPAHADRVALRDGTTMDGTVVVDLPGKTIVVTSTKGGMPVRDKVPFDKALAVETPEQKLSWLAGERDVVEASRVLWIATERTRYLEWADRALKAGDGPKASRLLDEAEKRGATGIAVKSRRQKVASAKPGTATPAAVEASKAIEAEEAALPKARATQLWSRLEGRWAGLDDARRFEYGELILSLDPANAPVATWFATLVPEEFRARFTWKEWIGWRRALGASGTLRVPPPVGATAKGMSATDKELARAASIWKRDVLGVVRDGFVLIARPPAGPGLERAVATSTAVFAFLEDLFRTPTPARKDPEPVSVWVHADRNDLWAHLSPIEERWADDHLRGLDGKKREHAAFFSPGEGLTKILSPDIPGTPEREAEIREDLAFCTTSHWLYARCPRFRWTETHESEKAPCCFVQADYLVSAVCRGAVDAKGGWALPDHSGVVFRNWKALKEMRKAAAWANVLDVSQKDLRALAAAAGENDTEVSEFDAYATQARLAALWFAYGADEGVRRRYADHLTDYELGRADLRTVRSVYGVDPVEFGRRIDEWASK